MRARTLLPAGGCKGITKGGKPCQAKDVFENSYCKHHGGQGASLMARRLKITVDQAQEGRSLQEADGSLGAEAPGAEAASRGGASTAPEGHGSGRDEGARMKNGRVRMCGPGGFKQPRLKVTCGDNGGRNRLGQPCGCRQLFKRGRPADRMNPDPKARCRFHGGMLAGPKTSEGWRRAIRAMKEGHARWLQELRAKQRG